MIRAWTGWALAVGLGLGSGAARAQDGSTDAGALEASDAAEDGAVAIEVDGGASPATETRAAGIALLRAQAQVAIRGHAHRELAALAAQLAEPTLAGRWALLAFVARFTAPTVRIDDVLYPLAVPEVATVARVLATGEGVALDGNEAALGSAGATGQTSATGAGGTANGWRPRYVCNAIDPDHLDLRADAGVGPPRMLSRVQIMEVANAGAASVRACGGGQAGTVVVSFLIAPDGTVAEARSTGAQAETPVGACAAGQVRAFRFPVFTGGPMRINMPFRL